MYRLIIICTLSIFGFALMAQGPGHMEREGMGERFKAQKVAFMTEKMDLTAEEAEKFWPVYNEFAKKRKELRSKHLPNEKVENLSEEEANKLLDDMMVMKESEMVLEKSYLQKFRNILPAKKILIMHKAEREFNQHVIKKVRERMEKRERPDRQMPKK